jgi:hypothetical protein
MIRRVRIIVDRTPGRTRIHRHVGDRDQSGGGLAQLPAARHLALPPFRGVQDRHEGRIHAGGVDKDLLFVGANEELNHATDAAYRTKYRRYSDSYVTPMIRPEARATTIKLVPRSTRA